MLNFLNLFFICCILYVWAIVNDTEVNVYMTEILVSAVISIFQVDSWVVPITFLMDAVDMGFKCQIFVFKCYGSVYRNLGDVLATTYDNTLCFTLIHFCQSIHLLVALHPGSFYQFT